MPPEPLTGLCHELVAELTAPPDPQLHFAIFKNLCSKTDSSKTARINACFSIRHVSLNTLSFHHSFTQS